MSQCIALVAPSCGRKERQFCPGEIADCMAINGAVSFQVTVSSTILIPSHCLMDQSHSVP